MADTDHLIRYVCTAAAHRGSTELGLTRNEGHWALCPDLLDKGHAWHDTGGLEVSEAVRVWKALVDDTARQPAA